MQAQHPNFKPIVPYTRQHFDSVQFSQLPTLHLPSTLPLGSVVEHHPLGRQNAVAPGVMFAFGERIPCEEDLRRITTELVDLGISEEDAVELVLMEDGWPVNRVYTSSKVRFCFPRHPTGHAHSCQ